MKALPFISEKYVEAINQFIDTTTVLTAKQLAWLSFMEHWASAEEYEDLNTKVEEVIAGNVGMLATMGVQLSAQGKSILIKNPDTQRTTEVMGFGYSTEEASYQVCIMDPDQAIIPLKSHLQIAEER